MRSRGDTRPDTYADLVSIIGSPAARLSRVVPMCWLLAVVGFAVAAVLPSSISVAIALIGLVLFFVAFGGMFVGPRLARRHILRTVGVKVPLKVSLPSASGWREIIEATQKAPAAAAEPVMPC